MHLFAPMMRQTFTILPFVLFRSIAALPSDLLPRADVDPCLDILATSDGPTSDKSAGIGVEFESSGVIFKSSNCNSADTNQAKGKQVGDRKGENWRLTADTTDGTAGRLTAEYILNGVEIKIGTGAAVAAAAAVAENIVDWNPYADMPDNKWNIDGNKCNPWAIVKPVTANGAGSLIWAMQITAPLPFEAINDLYAGAVAQDRSPLIPGWRPQQSGVSVTKEFFQSSPNGISQDDASARADILGFLSLVMSYVKQAKLTSPPNYAEMSPKLTTFIMPRTEFVTLFAQVKGSKLPGSDSLYNLVKTLACYRNDQGDVSLDSTFCGGTVEKPEPNTHIDGIGWCLKDVDKNQQDCLNVKDWINSIESGPSPDKLTILDRLIDGQIGGFPGSALENVPDTTRAVPLFEYRNLESVMAGDMKAKVDAAEKELTKYYDKYKSAPPTKKAKRNSNWQLGRRQAINGCSAPAAPSAAITAPPKPVCSLQNEDPDQGINAQGCVCGTKTLPLLTVASPTADSQSCAYTAIPSDAGPNPITIAATTYTKDCQACTLVGGIADTPTCTAIAGCASPTPTAAPPPPPPVCSAGFYGTDTKCGGKCNGPKSNCQCIEAGYIFTNEACTCKC